MTQLFNGVNFVYRSVEVYLREDIGLRPFFAISYPRVLKVFVRVSHVKKME